MKRLIAVAVLLVCSCASVTPRSTLESTLRPFDDFAPSQMEKDRIPAVTIGVIRGDEIWVRAYGLADLENKTPVRVDSSFRIASTQKPMTATAVLQLVEERKISLDEEIQTYVPTFPRKPYPVTVRQLLGHIGGISHYRNRDVESHYKVHKSTADTIDIFKDFDLIATPGTTFSYSTYGYNLLAAAVESVSHQPFGDYMRDHVWRPAGMNDTRMDDPDDLIPRRVRGYRIVDGNLRNSEFVDISSRFGGGGSRSTVVDLLRFARAYFGATLLKPSTVQIMLTPMKTADGKSTGYGMGWNVGSISGRKGYFHDGGQPETRTNLLWFAEERVGIAICTNLEADNYAPYLARIVKLLFDAPFDVRVEKD